MKSGSLEGRVLAYKTLDVNSIKKIFFLGSSLQQSAGKNSERYASLLIFVIKIFKWITAKEAKRKRLMIFRIRNAISTPEKMFVATINTFGFFVGFVIPSFWITYINKTPAYEHYLFIRSKHWSKNVRFAEMFAKKILHFPFLRTDFGLSIRMSSYSNKKETEREREEKRNIHFSLLRNFGLRCVISFERRRHLNFENRRAPVRSFELKEAV